MNETDSPIYAFSVEMLDGRSTGLEEFRGRVLLVVNTASQCGFTPQYAELETLYRKYREQGFAVLAFPCNQFGGQEPGTATEIGAFCETHYGVSFPVFAKIEVNGRDAAPLYRFLKREKPGRLGGLTRGRILWNFTKFLIGRGGEVVARYASATRPMELCGEIEKLLEER